MRNVPFAPRDIVRVGFMGMGSRGTYLMQDFLILPGTEVAAVYDMDPAAAERAARLVMEKGQREPRVFSGAEGGQRLLEMDIDLVYVTSPWEFHTPCAVAAMEAGKHVAVEVPAAVTLDECWQLVETSERTRRHCVMLENCCYGYWEMLVRRMAQAGQFGTLTHAECAYIHDLRRLLTSSKHDEIHWRLRHHLDRNGNLYPTHGLGPVARCLDIGGSDDFDYLVSVSSREAGLSEYCEPCPAEFRCGDMNLSIIRTKQGRTISLQHDVVTPRPYDRLFLIAGTKGLFRDYPPRLYLDGVGKHDEWLPLEEYQREWEDPLWTHQGETARSVGGHGGMDFLMNYRLAQALREGTPPDMDVYDAALWSVPGPLSEQSVASGSLPVKFPNFMRPVRK
jgi:predicted dehydrogenase